MSTKKDHTITPVFVIGAARNGTTQLVNGIGAHPEISSVEHSLHHGACESSVLRFKMQFGDFQNFDEYASCLYRFSSEDFFSLARGDVEYHLKRSPADYFEFFLDLMDNLAAQEDKRFWITKLDSLFFVFPRQLQAFMQHVEERYSRVAFVEIRRDLNDSIRSYLNMEGKYAGIRNKPGIRNFSILLQTARYLNTYNNELPGKFRVDFTDFVSERQSALEEIFRFIGVDNPSVEVNQKYAPNSSFTGKKKRSLGSQERALIELGKFLFRGKLSSVFLRAVLKAQGTPNPSYHRLLKMKYNEKALMEELEQNQAHDLIDQVSTSNPLVIEP